LTEILFYVGVQSRDGSRDRIEIGRAGKALNRMQEHADIPTVARRAEQSLLDGKAPFARQ
jgi:hypothetical protein